MLFDYYQSLAVESEFQYSVYPYSEMKLHARDIKVNYR